MVFSSILFTFLFLPVVIALYFVIRNDKARNLVLLAASLLFYAWGEPKFVFVMLASIAVNYVLARLIGEKVPEGTGQTPEEKLPETPGHAPNGAGQAPDDNRLQRRRVLLITAIACNLLLLFVFKYANFSVKMLDDLLHLNLPIPGIALPIGISFFTFQAMSYVIDVYRGETPPQKNPLYLALYISFFPQLIAGPIVRYRTIADQIEGHRVITAESFAEGARRFMVGFSKKVIIANNLAVVAAGPFGILDYAGAGHTVPYYWLAAIAYSLQILFDFSGYSDMAIGLGRMFGFRFDENFNYPYTASSVTDFWRRWHISLSSWFRDYVYIPLGGSRTKSVARHVFNIFVVWLLTGIWHGANYTFVCWGMMYFCLLILEKYFVRPPERPAAFIVLWRAVTLLAVMFAWVMFNAVGLKQGVHFWMAMLGAYRAQTAQIRAAAAAAAGAGALNAASGLLDAEVIRILREFGVYYLLGILFCMPVGQWIMKRFGTGDARRAALQILAAMGTVIAFLWAVSFLIMGSHNPFIYYNF